MKVEFFLYRKFSSLSIETTTDIMQKEVNKFIEDKDVIDIKSSISPAENDAQYIMVMIMYNDKSSTKKEAEKGESL